MAGFCEITLEGEYYNQTICNVLRYRAQDWLPLQGNPFADSLAFVDALLAHLQVAYLNCMLTDYTLRRASGVGYLDDYTIATSSPVIRTIDQPGVVDAGGMGAAQCAIINLMCGPQTQINGVGSTKRNRGYVAIGPLCETWVDDYSHLTPVESGFLNTLGALLDDSIVMLSPAVTLVPIRIHSKWLKVGPLHTLIYRTYSDVRGYSLRHVASYRRSRQPES